MPKKINNMNDLQKALMPAMTKMVDMMAERVYQTLNYFLDEFYNGWTPDSYTCQLQEDVLQGPL